MKRRWLQFRLRTLFGLLTLAAVATGGVVQHARYVQTRIRFHEARLANCEERLRMSASIGSWLSSRARPSPLLFSIFPALDPFANLERRDLEIASLNEAKAYHRKQVESYQHALWRPWIRVHDSRQETLDLPPEIAPSPPRVISP